MIQLQFLNKLLDSGDSTLITINNISEEFFSNYNAEFNYIKEHLIQYGSIPDKATFLSKFPNFDSIVVNEPNSYLLDELYKDRNKRMLAATFNDIKKFAISDNVDEAVNVLLKATEQITKAKHLESIDLLQSAKERFDSYMDKVQFKDKHFISTGFSELDEIIGGWDRQEELATIVARTGVGKSWSLIRCAQAAVAQGLRVGIYSGEMTVEKVGYRFDTFDSHISNSGLVKGKMDYITDYKKYTETLAQKYPDACCKVLTPNSINGPADVNALRSFIEKEKLDILFIDQHSLLEDARHGRTPVECASNISKDLKNLQVAKRIPIVAVSQLNRAKNEEGKQDTTNISQSDRIGQDSTTILLFEQDKEHRLLTMTLLKSRDSISMVKFNYVFDFDKGFFKFISADATEEEIISESEALRKRNLYREFEEDDTGVIEVNESY